MFVPVVFSLAHGKKQAATDPALAGEAYGY